VLQAQSGSPEEFLRSLAIHATLVPLAQAGAARVAQLTQKTNQFNVTTRRYTEGDVRRLAETPRTDVFAVRVRDRLGDSGVVGVVIARYEDERAVIDSFLLSCRVIGRGVEGALLAHLGDRARAAGCRVLAGEFIPTSKNAPARDFFSRHGFAVERELEGGHVHYRYDLGAGGPPAPVYITLEVEP
jgi:FkbH-like protein